MAEEEKKKEEEPNRIMVFLRIRPAKPGEINEADGTSYLMQVQPDNKTIVLADGGGKNYEYDWVFDGPNVEQEELYQKIAVPVIDNVFVGFWGTLMVYGQTGTGKSFTMCNFDPKREGIIPRAMRGIFERIEKDTERTYSVYFSFIQIYLDRLQDLFNPEGPELKIIRDEKGVGFPGVVEHKVNDVAHFRQLYEDGNQHRVIRCTKMNPESSRGHAALFVQIKSVPKDDPSGENRNGKLFMIDLAGYERFSKTGAEGIMKEEAKTINGSLLSLGNVVSALSERSEHVPWRNAKLTRMLEDAIGGKAKCSLILTAGPSSDHIHETTQTLYFGSRAMAVKTSAKAAVNIDYRKLAAKLQEMLNMAEGKISHLEIEATKRQLEREESEARVQAEWARVKARQEEQLQKLLKEGASPEQIQALIDANKRENDLLEEQHYQERQILEEQHEKDIRSAAVAQEQLVAERADKSNESMQREVDKLRRELNFEREEKEKYKAKAKEAEHEARRLMMELSEAKIMGEGAGFSAGGAVGNAELRREFERKVESIKEMLEETHQLQLQEMEEPIREEMQRYKKMYEDLLITSKEELDALRDALTSSYEEEIALSKKLSLETQEKLKANHLTIKRAYQSQKEVLEEENEKLLKQLAELTRNGGGGGPVGPSDGSAPSRAELVILKKQEEKKAQALQEQVQTLKSELEYARVEKEGLEKQLKEYEPKEGEERLKPAMVRKIKEENDKLKSERTAMENEIFKLKAAQALSGPQQVDADSDDDEVSAKDQIAGDFEGLKQFTNRMLKFPLFPGCTAIQNTHESIASSLTSDLDEYRKVLKLRIFVVGGPSTGKSTFSKCMLAGGVPLIASVPEVVTPTVHPVITSLAIDDVYQSKQDWYKVYVKNEDVVSEVKKENLLGAMGSLVGLSQKGVADPARIYLDFVDFPSTPGFWRGLPPAFLPGKNIVYCICYDLTHPIDIAKSAIESQLRVLHAATARNFSRQVGGDAPRVAVCLIGMKRDMMRERNEQAVVNHLNKVTVALGEVFFKIRGDDNYGLICIGNFAASAKDWTLTSSKGSRGPQTFKDLMGYIGSVSTQLYNNRPSAFIATQENVASHLTYMLGAEESIEQNLMETTSSMGAAAKRLRRGIVTLITGLCREAKVRWLLEESTLRSLAAQHLDVDLTSKVGIGMINYLLRELCVRNVITVVPSHLMNPKNLPIPLDELPPGSPTSANNARDEPLFMLEPVRMLTMYSTFMCPSSVANLQGLPPKDKTVLLYDPAALAKIPPLWKQGMITEELIKVTCTKAIPFCSGDGKAFLEMMCLLGLGIGVKTEVAIVSPAHLTRAMTAGFIDYVSYLISNFGDGLGRKYNFNTLPKSFLCRLQLRLVPFSLAPSKDSINDLNFEDGSFLILEKSRLKYGVFGSKLIKDAVMQCGAPLRGILKVENDNLYIAITARSTDSKVMQAAARSVVAAVHSEIRSLCHSEFRGIRVSFQEMVIVGHATKRAKLNDGISHILGRHGASPEDVKVQIQHIRGMSDPAKCNEIETALGSLPANFYD